MGNWDDEDEKDYNDVDTNDVKINLYNDEEDEGISLECEDKIVKILDPDLMEYFNEARLLKRRFPNDKKKKKDKIVYEAGQAVFINNKKHTILYGPYEQDGKEMYELETDDGKVISAEYKQINLKK